MNDNKILYARVQAPMLVLDSTDENIKNLTTKIGELIICKDSHSDSWGIKVGNGSSTIQNTEYLFKTEFEQLKKIKITDNFDENTDYLDQPKSIMINGQNFKLKISQGDPSELEANSIYFIY